MRSLRPRRWLVPAMSEHERPVFMVHAGLHLQMAAGGFGSSCPPPAFLNCAILRRGLKRRSCGHAACRPAGHWASECGLQRRRAKAGWPTARLANAVAMRGPGVIPGCRCAHRAEEGQRCIEDSAKDDDEASWHHHKDDPHHQQHRQEGQDRREGDHPPHAGVRRSWCGCASSLQTNAPAITRNTHRRSCHRCCRLPLEEKLCQPVTASLRR
jgi:hypothetical protein